MVCKNHHLETVSTPHQDFAAQGFWAQEPISSSHPLGCHPFGTCLRFNGVKALAAKLDETIGPIFVTGLLALLQSQGVVAQFACADGKCIGAGVCLMEPQYAKVAFVLGQPAFTKLATRTDGFTLYQLVTHCLKYS